MSKNEYIIGASFYDLESFMAKPAGRLTEVLMRDDPLMSQSYPLTVEGYRYVSPSDHAMFMTHLNNKCVIEPRYRYEEKALHRHFITYDGLTRVTDKGREILVYQRSKETGEGKLGAKFSTGIGGHVELMDLSNDSSYLDLRTTIQATGNRERAEELNFPILDAKGVATINGMFYIVDNSDAVGRVHMGFSQIFTFDPAIQDRLDVIEDKEHIRVGWKLITRDLLGQYDFENWSKMMIGTLIATMEM